MTYLYASSPANYSWFFFKNKNPHEHEQMCHVGKEMSKPTIKMSQRMSVFLKQPHTPVTFLRLSWGITVLIKAVIHNQDKLLCEVLWWLLSKF